MKEKWLVFNRVDDLSFELFSEINDIDEIPVLPTREYVMFIDEEVEYIDIPDNIIYVIVKGEKKLWKKNG